VLEAAQAGVGGRDQRVDIDARGVLDAQDVEIPVVRKPGGPNHRAVGPGRELIADGGMRGVTPGREPGNVS
jgi:hypothetical protein